MLYSNFQLKIRAVIFSTFGFVGPVACASTVTDQHLIISPNGSMEVKTGSVATFDSGSILTVTPGAAVNGLAQYATTTTKNVYLGIRTDGKSGTGLLPTDPYDCSTEAKFDAVMAAIPPNTVINIAPGTYTTLGSDSGYGGSTAWYLKNGWTVNGSGEGVTIIQLATGFNPYYHKHTVLQTQQGVRSTDVMVENLTVDANYPNMTPGTGANQYDAWGGVNLVASNSTIQNVEAINCFGTSQSNNEEFSLIITGYNQLLGYNNKIVNCYTHQYAAGAAGSNNYTNGCGLGGCVYSEIDGCLDDGAGHAFGTGNQCNYCKTVNCTSTANSQLGWYADTNCMNNILIEGNHFNAQNAPIQIGEPIANNVTIANNQLYSATGATGILLYGLGTNDYVTATASFASGATSFTVSNITGTIPGTFSPTQTAISTIPPAGVAYCLVGSTTAISSSYTYNSATSTVTLTNGGPNPGATQAAETNVSVSFFPPTASNIVITGNTFTSGTGTPILVADGNNYYYPMIIKGNIYPGPQLAWNGPYAYRVVTDTVTQTGTLSGGTATFTVPFNSHPIVQDTAATPSGPVSVSVSGTTATVKGTGNDTVVLYDSGL